MKAALLAIGMVELAAQTPTPAQPIPPVAPGDLPCDAKDKKPLLLGATTAEAILNHRKAFRDNLAKVKLTGKVKARWRAVKRPLTLVAVFGSWCSDSRAYLPDLMALEALQNPFMEVRYLGVYRDKKLDPSLWPRGCPPQEVHRVPTFYLFAPQPGGGQTLIGTVVERPPEDDQAMAEALVALLESAIRP